MSGSPTCFDLLDVHVIGGRADVEALRWSDDAWTYSRLLEEVAAFGGVLRHCGVTPGDRVDLELPESAELVVAVLACARIGAEHRFGAREAAVLVTDSTAQVTQAPVVLVKQRPGEERELVEGRDYDWDVVLRAGRTDPAPHADGAAVTPYDDRTRALLRPLLEGGTVVLG
jgi:propionyl-CoA synthetase